MVRNLEPGEVSPSLLTRRDKINEFDEFMVRQHKEGAGEQVAKYLAWQEQWNLSKEEFLGHCVMEDSCWIWKGQTDDSSNPLIMIDGVLRNARRIAWIIFKAGHLKGVIPENFWVVGTCGDSLCVNPGHAKLDYHKKEVRRSQYENK